MQFTFDSYIGENFNRCYFNSDNFRFKVIESFEISFERVGGQFNPEMGCWTFPKNVHSHIIELIIHNTCFECGGLMKDGEAIVDHEYLYTDAGKELWRDCKFSKKIKVRKCTVCGHSHT